MYRLKFRNLSFIQGKKKNLKIFTIYIFLMNIYDHNNWFRHSCKNNEYYAYIARWIIAFFFFTLTSQNPYLFSFSQYTWLASPVKFFFKACSQTFIRIATIRVLYENTSSDFIFFFSSFSESRSYSKSGCYPAIVDTEWWWGGSDWSIPDPRSSDLR